MTSPSAHERSPVAAIIAALAERETAGPPGDPPLDPVEAALAASTRRSAEDDVPVPAFELAPRTPGDPGGPAERDPAAWAIYAPAPDHDGLQMIKSLQLLALMVARRGGHVAGIYGEYGTPAGELAVLLGHAVGNRFAHLAVIEPSALGATFDAATWTATALFDLGIGITAYRSTDGVHPCTDHQPDRPDRPDSLGRWLRRRPGVCHGLCGVDLCLDDVGRALLGGDYGRTLDLMTTTVGTAPHNRRPGR